jgi:hypothetical protein
MQLTINSSDLKPVVEKGVVRGGKFEAIYLRIEDIGGRQGFLFATEISKHRCWDRCALAAHVPA